MPQKKYYFTEEEIKDIQDSHINDGLSYKELMLKYNIKCKWAYKFEDLNEG